MANYVGTQPLIDVSNVYNFGYCNPNNLGVELLVLQGATYAPPTIAFADPPGIVEYTMPLQINVYGDGLALVTISADYTGFDKHEFVFSGLEDPTGFDDHYDANSFLSGAGTTWHAYYVLPDSMWRGDFRLNVTAVNRSGNVVTASSNFMVNIDSQPAVSNIAPAVGSAIDNRTGSFAFRTSDETGLVQEQIYIRYASGPMELVFNGFTFVGPYSSSQRITITPGKTYDHLIQRSGGWPSDPSPAVAMVDSDGQTYSQEWSYTLMSPSTPVISSVIPAADSIIEPDTVLRFRTSDPTGLLTERVYVDFPNGQRELIWDGAEFSPRYSASSRTVMSVGRDFNYFIRRESGWSMDPMLVVQLIDTTNNIAEFEWGYALSGESDPQVLNIFPAEGSELEITSTVSFRTYDLTGLLAEFIYADVRGVREVVWDGTNFAANYARSSRAILDPGRSFDYTIVRDAGWASAPMFTVKLVDLDANSVAVSWDYTIAAVELPVFGGNTEPTDIEFTTADIYDALYQSVGDGLQAAPNSIVEMWRFARAEGLQVVTRDALAMKQAFPSFATDFISVYESILGIQLDEDLTLEEKQAELSRLYTQVLDATGPGLEEQLQQIHPSFKLYKLNIEHAAVTEVGVRAFEDWNPDSPLACGPRFDAFGRTFTHYPNFSTMFRVHVWLDVPPPFTDDHRRAIVAAKETLAEALPAWVDFTIFRSGGFILDQDLLDVTVFSEGLAIPDFLTADSQVNP